MRLKYKAFRAGFKTISRTRADYWLRSLARGRGVILTFHHVRPEAGFLYERNRLLEITPSFLDIILAELRNEGFEIISLDAVPFRLREKDTGRPFAVLTFDDGYRDNVEHAWPVLKRHAAPWTLFVTTDFASGQGRLWWLELEKAVIRLDQVKVSLNGCSLEMPTRSPEEKRRVFERLFRRLRSGSEEELRATTARLCTEAGLLLEELVPKLCLSWDELRSLAREPDVSIGAHTRSHFMLARHDISTAEREIFESKSILQNRLGVPIRHFAYPGGDRSCAAAREFEVAGQAGYTTALTTRPGHLFPHNLKQLHALPRVSVNGLFQSEAVFRCLLSGVPFLGWTRVSNYFTRATAFAVALLSFSEAVTSRAMKELLHVVCA
ncbi:MAG TPA: polysaccharide deacetylase family protein [Pseudolabrys sp.]|nr:polysaccharide deacetylase family protein [Pseudolabrys sp.]